MSPESHTYFRDDDDDGDYDNDSEDCLDDESNDDVDDQNDLRASSSSSGQIGKELKQCQLRSKRPPPTRL